MARGLLGELIRISKQAAREAERAQRAAERERLAAGRRAEQARKAEARSAQQLTRGREQERRRLEKEAKEAHVATQMAVVDEKNAELAEMYHEIDTLLQATLGVDISVDLEGLKVMADHAPFDRADLERPIAAPVQLPEPPKPILTLPSPPTGIGALFGKTKYERAVEAARAEHQQALAVWESAKSRLKTDFETAVQDHQRKEAERLETLKAEKQRYAAECRTREEEAAERNAEVERLIADLGYGVPEAVEEYVSIVLSNSVYPECFPVQQTFSFDPKTAELTLRALVPPPDKIPTIKAYKYTKATDEISTTELSQKACKDRYAGAVHQVALRTFHEVFGADRRGLIQTISLEVGTESIDPATGKQAYIPFVASGAERTAFMEFDLSAVVPTAALQHLGASVSKSPYALEGAKTSGIRKI
jgi:restriction system protein